MPKFACYKDGTDLTALVDQARKAKQIDPVIMALTESPIDYDALEQQVAATEPGAPIHLEIGADVLERDDAPDRGADVTRRIITAQKGHEPSPGSDGTEDWTVVVKCPKDQCENVFDSEIVSAQRPGGPATIVGYPPNMGDRFLIDAAKELGPDKSLARTSDSAKFVISNISLVALVVGGFSIFGDVQGGFDAYPVIFTSIAAAAAVSLSFSLGAWVSNPA